MKKIIILVVVLLLLGGAGGGAYWYFGHEAIQEGVAEAAKTAAKVVPPPPPPIYLNMDSMTVPVLTPTRAGRQMMLAVALEVVTRDRAPEVQNLMPRLRDAFIRDLFSNPIGSDGGWDSRDLEMIKARLQEQSTRVLGKDITVNVLIVNTMRVGR